MRRKRNRRIIGRQADGEEEKKGVDEKDAKEKEEEEEEDNDDLSSSPASSDEEGWVSSPTSRPYQEIVRLELLRMTQEKTDAEVEGVDEDAKKEEKEQGEDDEKETMRITSRVEVVGVAELIIDIEVAKRLRRGEYVFWDLQFCVPTDEVKKIDDNVSKEESAAVVVKDDNVEDDNVKDSEQDEKVQRTSADIDISPTVVVASTKDERRHSSSSIVDASLKSAPPPGLTLMETSITSSTVSNEGDAEEKWRADWSAIQRMRERVGAADLHMQKTRFEARDARAAWRLAPPKPSRRRDFLKRVAKEKRRQYCDAKKRAERLQNELQAQHAYMCERYPFRLGLDRKVKIDVDDLESIPGIETPRFDDGEEEEEEEEEEKGSVADDGNKKNDTGANGATTSPSEDGSVARACVFVVVNNLDARGQPMRRADIMLDNETMRQNGTVSMFNRMIKFGRSGPSAQLQTTIRAHDSPILDMDIVDLQRTTIDDKNTYLAKEIAPPPLSEIRILTCSEDHTLKLWDVSSGACVHTYRRRGECEEGEDALFRVEPWIDDDSTTNRPIEEHVFEEEAVTEAALKFQETEPIPGHTSGVTSCAIVPQFRPYYRELDLRMKQRLRRLAMSQAQRNKRPNRSRDAPVKKKASTRVTRSRRHPSGLLRDEMIEEIVAGGSRESLEDIVSRLKGMWSDMRSELLDSIRSGARERAANVATELAKMMARHQWTQIEETSVVERATRRARRVQAALKSKMFSLTDDDDDDDDVDDAGYTLVAVPRVEIVALRKKRREDVRRFFRKKKIFEEEDDDQDDETLRTAVRRALKKFFPLLDKDGLPIHRAPVADESLSVPTITNRRRARFSMSAAEDGNISEGGEPKARPSMIGALLGRNSRRRARFSMSATEDGNTAESKARPSMIGNLLGTSRTMMTRDPKARPSMIGGLLGGSQTMMVPTRKPRKKQRRSSISALLLGGSGESAAARLKKVPLSRGMSYFLNPESSKLVSGVVPLDENLIDVLRDECGIDLSPMTAAEVARSFMPFDVGIVRKECSADDIARWAVCGTKTEDVVDDTVRRPHTAGAATGGGRRRRRSNSSGTSLAAISNGLAGIQRRRALRTDRLVLTHMRFYNEVRRAETHARAAFRLTHVGSPDKCEAETRSSADDDDCGGAIVQGVEETLGVGGYAFRQYYTATTLAAEDGDEREARALAVHITTTIAPLAQKLKDSMRELESPSPSRSLSFYTNAADEVERCCRLLAAAVASLRSVDTVTFDGSSDAQSCERQVLDASTDPEVTHAEDATKLAEIMARSVDLGDALAASRASQYWTALRLLSVRSKAPSTTTDATKENIDAHGPRVIWRGIVRAGASGDCDRLYAVHVSSRCDDDAQHRVQCVEMSTRRSFEGRIRITEESEETPAAAAKRFIREMLEIETERRRTRAREISQAA
eukprot:g3352.t1